MLLSDGKTTTGRDPVEVARDARRARVPVYTVALGTAEGVIETPGGPLSVPPDPETMRQIARASGGRAFTASDAEGLEAVYERLGSQVGTRAEEREITAGFAAGGLVLLLGAAGHIYAGVSGGCREDRTSERLWSGGDAAPRLRRVALAAAAAARRTRRPTGTRRRSRPRPSRRRGRGACAPPLAGTLAGAVLVALGVGLAEPGR